jgi:hypothetical protein
MSQKIVVNGKEYDSVDAMPPDVRRLYESAMQLLGDGDGDGVPDIIQRGAGATDLNVATTQIVVDGRTYRDASELPPEARRKYEAAMRRLDADGNGVPDMVEGSTPLAAGASRSPTPGAPIVGAAPQVESTDRRFWLGLVVVTLIIVAVLAVWLGPGMLAR